MQRRDKLVQIQAERQKKWSDTKTFEVEPNDKPKYLVTFPYPYMNGMLHLGHGFTASKAEFAAQFQRLQGKNVLFPFGLHVTGMPIAACAAKLKNELDFGLVGPNAKPEAEAEPEPEKPAEDAGPKQFKAKKLKKLPSNKRQWDILASMGIPDEEIPEFAHTDKWLDYFPPKALIDMKAFGSHIDFRRSFITTERNPFYDSFIRWQFTILHAKGYLGFGKRNAVYSIKDGQPCQDHDRASGEGVTPQDYTLIKMQIQKPREFAGLQEHLDAIGDMKVFMPAATLRPETMYGQTNCWILPDGDYFAYKVNEEEVFIMGKWAALNLAYQEFGLQRNCVPEPLFAVKGAKMIGCPLAAPLCKFETIYTLPLLTISMEKGTGVVTSVPSDAPDDWRGLQDLKEKPALREKFGLKDEWVLPFEVVEILEIPELGRRAAETLCKQYKIQSQNDKDLLAQAKEEVYKKGFYSGTMVVGKYEGSKIQDAKVKIKADMLADGTGVAYSEPEKEVISRSEDKCVVCLCDQWYLRYGVDEEWKGMVAEHVQNKLECYNPSTKLSFGRVVDWLSEWPCSRSFGLGTRLPIKGHEQVLIDSLSDSTVYWAYYTVAHYLQIGADLSGEEAQFDLDAQARGSPKGLKPDDFTFDVWNYVFVGKPSLEDLETTADKAVLKEMRESFLYWYPLDLRVSAKDLVPNHLTMAMYNHAAVWEDQNMMPRSYFCNGMVMVDGEKMAKSKGNFLTLKHCINEWSADATRLALADSGDGLDDANFTTKVAESNIMKLTTLVEWCQEMVDGLADLRTGDFTPVDRFFENAINRTALEVKRHFSRMAFRDGMQVGWYQLQNSRDSYRGMCGKDAMHKDLVQRFMEVQCVVMAPIAPHTMDHIWDNVLKKGGCIKDTLWPEAGPVDVRMLFSEKYVHNLMHSLRTGLLKAKGKTFTKVQIFIWGDFTDLQKRAVKFCGEVYRELGEFPADLAKRMETAGVATGKEKGLVMPFVGFIKEQVATLMELTGNCDLAFEPTPLVNEVQLLAEFKAWFLRELELEDMEVFQKDDAAAPKTPVKNKAMVGKPTTAFA